MNTPPSLLVIPTQLGDGSVELAVRPQIVFLDNGGEILQQLGLLAIELAPVIGWLKGIAVLVTANIDSCSRVAVLPPCTTWTWVLLDDNERQTGLLEADAGKNPGHTASDDHDRKCCLDVLRNFA